MKIRNLISAGLVAIALSATADVALASDPGAQDFVQQEHQRLTALLKQDPSADRDQRVNQALDNMVDYEELTRRAFGEPCPSQIPSCTNHWAELSPEQKTRVTGLLKKLVEKNYRKNLIKTLQYDVAYKGARDGEAGDTKIRTEAKSKDKPRDPPVLVDYAVQSKGGQHKVVNIYTENSSLTKNYYDIFHKWLTNPAQGEPYLEQKLQHKIDANDDSGK